MARETIGSNIVKKKIESAVLLGGAPIDGDQLDTVVKNIITLANDGAFDKGSSSSNRKRAYREKAVQVLIRLHMAGELNLANADIDRDACIKKAQASIELDQEGSRHEQQEQPKFSRLPNIFANKFRAAIDNHNSLMRRSGGGELELSDDEKYLIKETILGLVKDDAFMMLCSPKHGGQPSHSDVMDALIVLELQTGATSRFSKADLAAQVRDAITTQRGAAKTPPPTRPIRRNGSAIRMIDAPHNRRGQNISKE